MLEKNYLDRKTERRGKFNKKRKGKVTKDHKNFKSIKIEELRSLESSEDLQLVQENIDGAVSAVHTQE